MTLGIILTLNILGWIIFLLVFRVVLRRAVRPKQLLSQVEEEIDSLLIELNGTTERNIRILEETIRRLKNELEQADKRIRVLNSEQNKRDSSSVEVGRTDYSHLASRKPLNIKVLNENENDKDKRSAAVTKEKNVDQKPENSDIKESILTLYRQGMDARLIASKVGRPIGEVELIISISE